MRRVVSVVMSACVLISLAILTGPAKAGDYYDDGYYRQRHSSSWSSSDCCYKKIVRHERSVHYRRLNDESYYDRPRYDERPYRRSYTYDTPRRYYDNRHYDNRYSRSSYYGSNYSSYADSCYRRSVPIADNRGGWVWGTKSNCY